MARTKRTRPIPKSHQPPLKIQKKSVGGMLVGPSHEQGGIPALVDGTEPIEVEGGEFVVNAKTVESLGEGFLHKLNSTSTPYHTGGFDQGQLPSPSLFKQGGILDPKDRQHGLMTDEKLENPVNSIDYELSSEPQRNKRKFIKNLNNRKRAGGTVKKLQDGGTVIQRHSTRLPAHTAYERQKPCPLGMFKNTEGVCFQMTGQPYDTNKIEGRQILGGGGIGSIAPGAIGPGYGAKMSHFRPGMGGGNAAHFQSYGRLGKGQFGGTTENIANSVKAKKNKNPLPQDKVNLQKIIKPTAQNQGKKTHSHTKVADIYGSGHTINGPGHEHLIQEGRILITCPENDKCHSH